MQEAFLKAYRNLTNSRANEVLHLAGADRGQQALMNYAADGPSARFRWMKKSRLKTTQFPRKSRIGARIPSSSIARRN